MRTYTEQVLDQKYDWTKSIKENYEENFKGFICLRTINSWLKRTGKSGKDRWKVLYEGEPGKGNGIKDLYNPKMPLLWNVENLEKNGIKISKSKLWDLTKNIRTKKYGSSNCNSGDKGDQS